MSPVRAPAKDSPAALRLRGSHLSCQLWCSAATRRTVRLRAHKWLGLRREGASWALNARRREVQREVQSAAALLLPPESKR